MLRKEAFYEYPPEAVWIALTDRHALAEWLMPNNFEPVLGHKFRFQYDKVPLCGEGLVECEVLEIEKPRLLVLSWMNTVAAGKPQPPTMRVSFTLTPEQGGTRLVLEQTGLEGQPWWIPLMMNMGWGTMLKRWVPKVLKNVNAAKGTFRPGAIPLHKRGYKARTVPDDLTK